MQGRDYALVAVLAAFALFIWVRDTTWIASAADTLPILAAVPLFFWLGAPWAWNKKTRPLSEYLLLISAFLFVLGILLDLTLLLAASWTILFWAALSTWSADSEHSSMLKLLILPMMAFPWIALDANSVGWWFRLSGAWATGTFFSLLGSQVVQQGTSLVVDGLLISVEAACSGMNTLQSILIAGTVVAYIFLKDTPRFWWSLPIIGILAWASNTARIIGLSAAALLVSPEFALGLFHTWGGWLILLVMFLLCWLAFSLLEPKEPTNPKHD
jgi:exosortase/archaeosortase family protein